MRLASQDPVGEDRGPTREGPYTYSFSHSMNIKGHILRSMERIETRTQVNINGGEP